MAVQIQQRRDTAAAWTAANPTLAEGEFGLETDTQKIKIGNGLTVWTALAYHSTTGSGLPAGGAAGALLAKASAADYDDVWQTTLEHAALTFDGGLI